MSIEFAGNPSKMSAILGGMRPADLSKVTNAGIEQNAYDKYATTERNLGALNIVDLMDHKAEMSEMGIAHKADIAAMQQANAQKNAFIQAGGSALFGTIKGSGYKMFGGGSDLSKVDPSSSVFSGVKDEADSSGFFTSDI